MDEREPVVRRALLNPLELCLTAIKELIRLPLERYGQTMFQRGVRYERDRTERLTSTAPPLQNPALTEENEFDPDKTPTRRVRPLGPSMLASFDPRVAPTVDLAKERVVPPRDPDPRSK